jgi:hypothetical protein
MCARIENDSEPKNAPTPACCLASLSLRSRLDRVLHALSRDPALDHVLALALRPGGPRDLGHRGFNRQFVAWHIAISCSLSRITIQNGSTSGGIPECVPGIDVWRSRLQARRGFESATHSEFVSTSIHVYPGRLRVFARAHTDAVLCWRRAIITFVSSRGARNLQFRYGLSGEGKIIGASEASPRVQTSSR